MESLLYNFDFFTCSHVKCLYILYIYKYIIYIYECIYICIHIYIFIYDLTFHTGGRAVLTRHSWDHVSEEPLAGGALVAKLGTNCYDSRMVGSN